MKKVLWIKIGVAMIIIVIVFIIGSGVIRNKNTDTDDTLVATKPVQWLVGIDDLQAFQFDLKENNYHITNAVLVKNNQTFILTKKEYLKLLEKKCKNGISLNGEENKTICKFIPKKMHIAYAKEEVRRVTSGFENVEKINMQSNLFVGEGADLGGISNKYICKSVIDKAVEEKYKLYSKVLSYESKNETEGFKPSGKYKYAAIAFIPSVAVVSGKYSVFTGKFINKTIEMNYPYVNDSGILEGIFILLEGDDFFAFPES